MFGFTQRQCPYCNQHVMSYNQREHESVCMPMQIQQTLLQENNMLRNVLANQNPLDFVFQAGPGILNVPRNKPPSFTITVTQNRQSEAEKEKEIDW